LAGDLGRYGGGHRLPPLRAEGITLLDLSTAREPCSTSHRLPKASPGDLVYATFLDMVDPMSGNAAWLLRKMRQRARSWRSVLRDRAVAPARPLGAEGINAVIWATGYGVDFGWIDIPYSTTRAKCSIAAASRPCPASISLACNGFPG